MAVIDKNGKVYTPLRGFHEIIDVTTSTLTLNSYQSGALVLLDRAAGATITLPAPQAGMHFTFVVVTSASTGSYKVITDAATTFMMGSLGVPVSTGTQKLFFADGTTIVSVNLNGTTTGGLLGGSFEAVCLDGTQWQIFGNVEGSGTVATPFAIS